MKMDGKRVLVTGASRGIGEELLAIFTKEEPMSTALPQANSVKIWDLYQNGLKPIFLIEIRYPNFVQLYMR